MKREERSRIRYVLVVQCEKSRQRCSGFACEELYEGTYVSARAQKKREAGVYRNYPTLEME